MRLSIVLEGRNIGYKSTEKSWLLTTNSKCRAIYHRLASMHCCMKCTQILREKTSSEKYTVISLRVQWKLSAEGNALRKCQKIILQGGVLALCEFHYCEFHYCGFSKPLLKICLMQFL